MKHMKQTEIVKSQDNHRYYKPQEVADMLRISRETVMRMCRNPELDFGTRVGSSWRISEQDIRDLKKTTHSTE